MEIYEKLGEQPVNKRVLVIRDLFTAMHASIDNAVTFVTDDEQAEPGSEWEIILNTMKEYV